MQSLKKRLADRRYEILDFTRKYGRYRGQDYAGVKDYIAWTKWLEAETGNPNFGVCPTNPDEVRSDCEVLRAKAHSALGKLLSALDDIAESERQKLLAEKELRLFLWRYMGNQGKGKPCEVKKWSKKGVQC